MFDTDEETAVGSYSGDLRQSYCNTPLLVSSHVEDFLRHSAAKAIVRKEPEMALPLGFMDGQRKPYEVNNGVAIIQVRGVLEHKTDWYSRWWTGYPAIRKRLDMAMEDHQVRGILFVHHSGGGHVAGNFELNDHIYEARGSKPMWSMVDEYSYSGAYSLASSTDKILVTRTGGVGSIGAVMVLANMAKMLEQAGIGVEVIRSGDRKMKPNAYEAFEQADLDRLQAQIDQAGDLFIESVARNRNIDAGKIRKLQGATFMAEEAIEIGLADGISTFDKALVQFQQELSGSSLASGGQRMSTTEQPNSDAGAQNGITKEQHESAVSNAREEGKTLGAQEENARIMGILSCEEAKGKTATAMSLAQNPGMTADSAKQVLATVPAEAPAAAAADPLTAAMEEAGSPGVSSEEESSEGKELSEADKMAALYDQAHGAPKTPTKRH